MEMMPAIANYFHVSIDALFGYYDDREDKIKTILDRASSLIDHQGFVLMQGDVPNEVSECVEMLREASEEFPNEPKIFLKLGKALLYDGMVSIWLQNTFRFRSGVFGRRYGI